MDEIRVMNWNSDKQLPSKINSLIHFARSKRLHAIGIQETANLPLGAEKDLENQGYILLRHEQVALLIDKKTIGIQYNPTDTWKSETYNSLAITIPVQGGSLLIAVAYLPTGIDTMSATEKDKAMYQHAEICARATNHTHAILLMDANETTHPQGRREQRLHPQNTLETWLSGNPTRLEPSTTTANAPPPPIGPPRAHRWEITTQLNYGMLHLPIPHSQTHCSHRHPHPHQCTESGHPPHPFRNRLHMDIPIASAPPSRHGNPRRT